jgi:hypothetical protein
MSMDIYSKPGTKVEFLDRNGHEWERKEAEKILEVGQIYTVESIDVGDWCSYVTFEEVSGEFNSVMFDNMRLK